MSGARARETEAGAAAGGAPPGETSAGAQVAVEIADRIMTLTLDRPERLNAFTPRMTRELVAALDLADASEDVRCVLVTGAGRGFCAGADLSGDTPFGYADPGSYPGSAPEDTVDGRRRDGGGQVATRLAELRKPVIAAINGPAVGVGATITLPMDIRIEADTARFGFPYVRRGIAPEALSSWFLPRVVGISRALDWMLTGRIFTAEEALSGGLISRIVPPERLLTEARSVALEIADSTSATSVAVTRRLLWSRLATDDLWATHIAEMRLIEELKRGPDAREGVASFLEKRPPEFSATLAADLPGFLPVWPRRPDWAH